MDMLGNKRDKVKTAIDRIRAFCPPEGYFVAFSGGKDSVVIKGWPVYKKLYIKAFDDMLEARRAAGKTNQWSNGEDVFRWWIGDKQKHDPNQMSIDEIL